MELTELEHRHLRGWAEMIAEDKKRSDRFVTGFNAAQVILMTMDLPQNIRQRIGEALNLSYCRAEYGWPT